ncbi:hypothetical protein [Neochlamydia sp. S13]|uniref:IS1096 element passenger TnpR family protein n=1 Tax=Neochlamydia sp. S13 TaxID=1353976 RepID=UPI000693DE22|nr:hypothetical protein [Neochlamydia sp. S13]BBI17580.1 Uncharacterized protein NCS13_1_1385 [Neochlamydia sp. S13]
MKTKGTCTTCGKTYSPSKGSAHLLGCALKSLQPSQSTPEGYLLRISWAEEPGLYWMFVAIPQNTSLGSLDAFLRTSWLECCGHLSEFTIGRRHYMSHTESGKLSPSMNHPIGKILSPGLEFTYIYDMGSSTELDIQVTEKLAACPQKEISILMRNDPPAFLCEACNQAADIICSLCGSKLCAKCSTSHPCAIDEKDTYMLMPLVNSPRAGVCGYTGE